ncbi:hypothetical protein L3X38_040106 [Prunus dulcis]|uniref:NADH:ubiquinone oxidoreductase intermediate-associated protein 30 domain-containing protein n=1 Tax=Prunus dulcis TaxID=3755 RepID=A0AAD4V9I2_PRUDU|nr:hypothetical protein L3X38_040106 [Prunus dulcis]
MHCRAGLGFDTVGDQWQTVCVPFSSLKPIFQARTVSDAPPFDPSNIVSLQLMFSKFEFDGKLNPTFVEGAFKLPLSSIRAYLKEPITPRFVHLGSAGATRPDRPGLDLSKQPPAVRLNKELDFILTFKLKVLTFKRQDCGYSTYHQLEIKKGRWIKSKTIWLHNSDWPGSVDDMTSTSGYAFTIGSGIFSWSSRK